MTMVGLNHGCWGVEHDYDGQDPLPLLEEAWERRRDDPTLEPRRAAPAPARRRDGLDPGRLLRVLLLHRRGPGGAAAPSPRRAPRTSSAGRPTTGATTKSRPGSDDPQLDPARSRGGIHELELAIDVMDAIFNDKDEVPSGQHAERRRRASRLPGRPRRRGARSLRRATGSRSLPAQPLPRHVRGLVEMLGEYQALAAETAWTGTRARRHPSARREPARPRSSTSPSGVYDALASAHRAHLPDRLVRTAA